MDWMAREPDRRADPRRVLAGCRSVIAVGMNYYTSHQADERPGHGRIARYAWGEDYHEVLMKRLAQLGSPHQNPGAPTIRIGGVDRNPVCGDLPAKSDPQGPTPRVSAQCPHCPWEPEASRPFLRLLLRRSEPIGAPYRMNLPENTTIFLLFIVQFWLWWLKSTTLLLHFHRFIGYAQALHSPLLFPNALKLRLFA